MIEILKKSVKTPLQGYKMLFLTAKYIDSKDLYVVGNAPFYQENHLFDLKQNLLSHFFTCKSGRIFEQNDFKFPHLFHPKHQSL